MILQISFGQLCPHIAPYRESLDVSVLRVLIVNTFKHQADAS